jgi:hypothetical protein
MLSEFVERLTDRRSANRSAVSERPAQENLSQFNNLDLVLPWFETSNLQQTKRSKTS